MNYQREIQLVQQQIEESISAVEKKMRKLRDRKAYGGDEFTKLKSDLDRLNKAWDVLVNEPEVNWKIELH